MDLGRQFLDESRRYLTREYAVKIRLCLDDLTDEDLWWRPNEQSNGIGNLLLHLAGNVRQWIVSGVAGVPDTRRRQAEFDERGPMPREELLRRFDGAVAEVDAVLRASAPGAPPFVDVGTKVRKGNVICIIEAMKLMNEIESEVDGEVVRILVENGNPVEYGEPLFLIEPL